MAGTAVAGGVAVPFEVADSPGIYSSLISLLVLTTTLTEASSSLPTRSSKLTTFPGKMAHLLTVIIVT